MGVVTEYLINLISKQVEAAGVVVWYDPEAHYREVAKNLPIPNTTVALYQGSFFALRHEIEPLLGNVEPPRLVVYVPLKQEETRHALIEVETAGVVMKPGQQPPTRNTRLSLLARNALKSILSDGQLTTIEKQVEAGSLSLVELDRLAEKGEGIAKGVLALLFETDNPQEMALRFLSSTHYDGGLAQKEALPEWASLLQQTFEVDLPGGENAESYRARLARHILTADFLISIEGRGALPAALSTVKIATRSATRDASVAVARTWRFRRDLALSYETHAGRVENELGLSTMYFTQGQLAHTETFLATEGMLQEAVALALLTGDTQTQVDIAATRQASFWAEHLPEIQAQWALLASAGQVLLEADGVERALKTVGRDATAIFRAYTGGDHPWCLLDTSYRRMEHRYYELSFQLQDWMEQLLSRARQRYTEVGSRLAETFLHAYQEQKFQVEGALRQRDIFLRKVKPRLPQGKVAYVWVDALRYEMGFELAQKLAADGEVEIEGALATMPTITEIGMASLLPISPEELVSVVAVGEGKLALDINGTCVKDRKDRVNYLRAHAGTGISIFEAKLEDLLPKPVKKVRERNTNAHLVLITSQEIDAMGEEDNVLLARRTMEEILRHLRAAFRVLWQMGVETIIVSADHGHLFADELSDDMKIDAPGGDTKDLHRRVWVGHGGATNAAYMRVRLADFGLGGDLELAVPWNFACFKVKGGAEVYFHGGLSPQELFIPVITLTSRKKAAGATSEVIWKLSLGSQKVSTRFCSVQVSGQAKNLLELVAPRVRLEVRHGQECISRSVSASYGLDDASSEVQMRQAEQDPQTLEPNTVALYITEPLSSATVSISLIDAVSNVELARLDRVEMAIAI